MKLDSKITYLLCFFFSFNLFPQDFTIEGSVVDQDQQAIELATEIQPEQVFFTHMSHLMGKHADVEVELPPNISLAYDGLEISIR